MSHHKHDCVDCFDPEILEIIRCVCSLDKLVDDVFKCLSCRPNSRSLQQILACVVLGEVRKVESLLTNETYGLSEIKTEVRQIETAVQALSSTVNSDFAIISQELTDIEENPVFGLRKIESEIRVIDGEVRTVERELKTIEGELKTIEDELQIIEDEIKNIENNVGIRPRMTTGPVFICDNARHLTVQVLNNTSETHTVTVRVLRIDKQPFQETFNKLLEIPPLSAREFKYIDLDSSDFCGNGCGQIEVILDNLAEGLYPTVAQFNSEGKIIPYSIFKSCDFMAEMTEVQ